MNRRHYTVFSLLLMLTILAAAACHGEQAVPMFVGNKPVDTTGISNAVLQDTRALPVRRMAEALGGKVSWNRASNRLTIVSSGGISTIRIGSRRATIRGISVDLPFPPYLDGGNAYAPIILFNRQFDMALIWDYWQQRFRWVPIVPPRGGTGAPPPILLGPGAYRQGPAPSTTAPVPASRTVVGEVIRAIPDRLTPRIVVMYSGDAVTYRVPADAIILRGTLAGQFTEAPLGAIRPGDRVTIRFDQYGSAASIRAQYRFITGKAQSIDEGMIALDSGTSLKPGPRTQIVMPDNTLGDISDVLVGDTVTASASPMSGNITVIKIMPRTAATGTVSQGPGQRDQLTINTTGPFRAGDVLVVGFLAHAGGKAAFSIPGVKDGIAMTEQQPGFYQGQYTVQSGDMLVDQPVTVTFTAAGGERYTKPTPPITIRTIAGYLPRITSPRQGQQIVSPIVVRGIAQPGATVRVTIEYRANLQSMLPLEGTSDTREVVADRNGNWQTSEMSAAVPFYEDRSELPFDAGVFTPFYRLPMEKPIVWSITATTINPNGQEGPSYTVETTKSPARVLGGVPMKLVENKVRPSG